jgi:hypothetical protein
MTTPKLGYIEVFEHPLSVALRENFDAILTEFQTLSNHFLGVKPNNQMGGVVDQKESNGKILYQGKINSVFTRVAESSCSKPEYEAVWGKDQTSYDLAEKRFKQKQALTPTLEKILEPYGTAVGCVGFNIMHPPANLSMHYGMVSKYARFHMGIICDPEAKFHVGEYAPRAWEPGKVWCFDDGDAFHGTTHNGTDSRVILIVDLDRVAIENLREEEQWG